MRLDIIKYHFKLMSPISFYCKVAIRKFKITQVAHIILL